jgi:spore photoproduct lyase
MADSRASELSCAGAGEAKSFLHLVRTGPTEMVCPNFYVLNHATGCRFTPQCSYCYLRDQTQYPPGMHVQRDLDVMLDEVREWIARDALESYVLNAGNLSDSLCFEEARPLMAKLVDLFREQAEERGRPHTLLLVTKGGVKHCAELLAVRPSRNVIISFSVNCPEAAARYERGAATPEDRLAAAAELSRKGWRVRVRIDPMIRGYDYTRLIEAVRGIRPERVTLGCLRADGRLGDYVAEGTLEGLLAPKPGTDGWYYPVAQRLELYRPAVVALKDICSIGLCEEGPAVWDDLGLDTEGRSCNCNHV